MLAARRWRSLARAVAPLAGARWRCSRASLGAAALALCALALLARPLPPLAASLALVLALGAGLRRAVGEPAYALGCQLAGVLIWRRRCRDVAPLHRSAAFMALLAALALLGGGLGFDGRRAAAPGCCCSRPA